MPDAWERPAEPEFPAWAEYIWQCWRELDGERPMHGVGGMGTPVAGPIPWACLDRWALRHGIEGADFDLLLRLIGAMDTVFLEHIRNKAPKT